MPSNGAAYTETRKTAPDQGSRLDRPRYHAHTCWTLPLTLKLYRLSVPVELYSHGPFTDKDSSSKVSWFRRQSGNRQTDGQIDVTNRLHYLAVWLCSVSIGSICCGRVQLVYNKSTTDRSVVTRVVTSQGTINQSSCI